MKPVIHNARFGHFPIQCACGNTITLALVKGYNRRVTICVRCQAILRIGCKYDGYGVATLREMTIEQLESSDDGK